jgi:chromosome segregation ATPase
LAEGHRQRGSDGSWARRRIERLENRINDLERDLLQTKAEWKTLAAERDELRLQLEHSQAHLALLSDRVSSGKPREGRLSKLLEPKNTLSCISFARASLTSVQAAD